MNKKNITILTIGDKSDYDSYQKFDREKASFIKYGFDYATIDYKKFLNGKIPQIKTEKIIIFLFFPFSYWDKYIEYKNYRGIYGNRTFHRKFVRFWNLVEKKVKKHLADKEILFINKPDLCGVYRDKMNIVERLAKSHFPQPRLYKMSGIKEIQDKLTNTHQLFLKPRYGSMGKGITFLSRTNWQTNFIFRNNKIVSRRSDHGWKFRDITGNLSFLRQLLKKDILIEEAVDQLILNGDKADFRIYTFFNKVIYIYPRENALDKVTTNISQGGWGAPEVLKILPQHLILKAKTVATEISKTLGINLAGIDIIPDRNCKDVHVIDVNVFSGFPKRKTFNLARSLAEELERLHHKGMLRFTSPFLLTERHFGAERAGFNKRK
ncbi:MAG: hypothetical protein ISS44_02395 [Candidatus Omnitrophica bacterium]|nr:hypothetical protein [Candidatus Omnitrophota bacterium]